jgi:hypothetical protein
MRRNEKKQQIYKQLESTMNGLKAEFEKKMYFTLTSHLVNDKFGERIAALLQDRKVAITNVETIKGQMEVAIVK